MSLVSDNVTHHSTVRSSGIDRQKRGKRFFDVVFTLTVLLFLAPAMALIALGLLLQDGRPIFFGHKRIGKNGRVFTCLKFRTMRKDADKALRELLEREPARREEWAQTQKLRDDPRVHTLGRYLRITSLDELPQFINVLKGEMSVVGPRPIMQEELSRYGSHVGCYLAMTPGITGPWQISPGKNDSYEQRVQLDVEYYNDCSLAKDITIILKTAGVVLFARNEGQASSCKQPCEHSCPEDEA